MMLQRIKYWYCFILFYGNTYCTENDTIMLSKLFPAQLYIQQSRCLTRYQTNSLCLTHLVVLSLCICCPCMRLTYVYTFSLSHTHTQRARTIASAAAELLHCSMAQVLPLQIRLLDNLSQLQYEGKWLTSIIYISQPLSLSLLVIPQRRVMHQGPVSQATQFELAQFIKPGPVHKPEFTRRRHLQQTAAAHSWWEGQADVQGKSKGETGESLWASVCQPQWEALHPLLKDRVQLAELVALSCLQLPWFCLSHSKHCNNSTCWQYQLSPRCSPFEPRPLWHKRRWSGSGGWSHH